MIYIFEDGNVVYDGSTISEKQKADAIVVTERPIEEIIKGKYSILKWDVEAQTAWYEYEDIPLTEIEEVKEDLNNAIMELTMLIAMGGM